MSPLPTKASTNWTGSDDDTGHILHSMLLFAEVLRGLGLDVGSGNVLDLVRATEYFAIGRKQDFYHAARCLLVHRKQDMPLFDEAFQVFWRKPKTRTTTQNIRSMGEETRFRKPQVALPPVAEPDTEGGSAGENDDSGDSVDLTRTYSAREVLREKDFSEFSTTEINQSRRMMAQLTWKMDLRRTRRLIPGRGQQLDLRKTLRLNLKYGGEPIELAHLTQKDKLRPLVLICDVSGSMERYTRILLHFIHTISGEVEQVEAFLFATRLTRITRYLIHRGVDQTVDEVAKVVPDWAGGTRIGQALKTFNFQWLRRVLSGGAVVLIISDGWDRGEPELLAQEAARLQRSCHRLIWLNPLLGSPEYQPLTRGMQAAMPYVDDFLPVHNLNSLESLAKHLNSLSTKRQLGPQYRPKLQEEVETSEAVLPGLPPLNPRLAPTFRHPLWGRGR